MFMVTSPFTWQTAGYNGAARVKGVAVAESLLDTLKEHHADNFGWALACCAWQRNMAEDVLQESYLRVLDGRARFAGSSSRRTWFFAVIRRVAAEQRRGQARRSILNLRLARGTRDDPEFVPDTHGESVYRDESARRLQAALMQLAVRQREVLHLVFYGDMTIEEAAITLRVSVGSARTHYHRGKERLAQLLLQESDDGA